MNSAPVYNTLPLERDISYPSGIPYTTRKVRKPGCKITVFRLINKLLDP